MTVAELIEELKGHKPEMTVFVRGYESGYDEAGALEVRRLVYKPHRYCGTHDDARREDTQAPECLIIH